MQMLQNLPAEVLLSVTLYISCKDMSSLRLVSRKMRTFCDHPINWKSIYLQPDTHNIRSLWKLATLKDIITPHVSHIQSIHIWDVRDNTIHYLLSQCKNLQHLTICGWTTLSDHGFRFQPSLPLKLKTLELIGSPNQTNYISADAYTLGNLMLQSPEMTSLVFGCDINIHAETLISELENAAPSEATHLQSFTLATRRTWLNDHVIRLINLYPTIQQICLTNTGVMEYILKHQGPETFDSWITDKLKKEEVIIPYPYFKYPLISTENMIMYSKTLVVG